MRCLVTGAAGYVGGRLVPELLTQGYEVRCLVRSVDRLRGATWRDRVSVVEADLDSGHGLADALDGVEVAYYLVHSLAQPGFVERDREAASRFAAAARQARVKRIIYLGGPDPGPHQAASAHLRSRREVAEILLGGEVPAIVLRAAMIIGSGSASFEMLRYLTERLPVMVTPRWVGNRIEPIAIHDVLRYLVASAEAFPGATNRAFDIGSGEVLTYSDMMRRYAEVAQLPARWVFPVRPLTPELSALWVGLVTPVPNAIARPLVASLINEAVTHEHDIAAYIADPPGGLTHFDESVRLALRKVRDDPTGAEPLPAQSVRAGSVRAGSVPAGSVPADPLPTDPDWTGGTVYRDDRTVLVDASPQQLWRVIEEIGGENGWHSFPLVWTMRGWLDRAVGGIGPRRGRRDPHRLRVGDTLDFWRVEEVVPGELLRLRAELRLPGRAWLELRVSAHGQGGSRYDQRVTFLPSGLPGHAYWASVVPIHSIVFGAMARNIATAAERAEALTAAAPAGA